MKNKLKLAALMLGAALLVAPAMAKEKKAKKGKEAAPAISAEMMAKWTAYATPGDAHKVLNPLAGSFTYISKMYMAPGAKPEVSSGTADGQWILGGRYLQMSVKGTAMGMPFEGFSLMGYDNEKKQYDELWLDNLGTGMTRSSGQYDPSTKTLVQSGSMTCPMEGTKSFRSKLKFVDDGSHVYEMYMPGPDGKDFLGMELTYKRKP